MREGTIHTGLANEFVNNVDEQKYNSNSYSNSYFHHKKNFFTHNTSTSEHVFYDLQNYSPSI